MDIHSACARLQLMSDLRRTGTLAKRIFDPSADDWRLHPIEISPGWIDLVSEMLDQILALPDHKSIGINFIRSSEGTLDLSWRGESQANAADRICIAARAKAGHVCQWCGERGRYQHMYRRVLCQTHAALIATTPLKDISFEDRVMPGAPYPRRKMLIGLAIKKRTESGLTAALHTDQGEQGFEPEHWHLPIAWLTATGQEADLFMIEAERVALNLDQHVFRRLGEARAFALHPAEPILVKKASTFGVSPAKLADLITKVDDWDPEIRVPAFETLMRIFDCNENTS